MLRAGPFSDERVRRLANRRFVSFTFDLMPSGALADPQAREFVVERREEFGGKWISNEPLMIMSAAGEILAETARYGDADHVLRLMRRVLDRHPEYDKPLPGEEELEHRIALAEVRIDLGDYAGARRTLAGEKGDAARYLAGHATRLARDWKGMEKELAQVKDEALASDVHMERAYPLWHGRRYEALLDHVRALPEGSVRRSEAGYFEGLALYHTGKRDEAKALWKELIQASPQGPWVYRADWAYVNAERGPARGGVRVITSTSSKRSPLGRIDYMGPRNPDLRGPGS